MAVLFSASLAAGQQYDLAPQTKFRADRETTFKRDSGRLTQRAVLDHRMHSRAMVAGRILEADVARFVHL